jgi:peptidoglycan/xylan/chitin deacetylase (PgdA/CDA1 family)
VKIEAVKGKYHRFLAYRFHRRMVEFKGSAPMISFTFDDAPVTAFTTGGDILGAHGANATFFVSLGLLGSETEVGAIAVEDDIVRSVKAGNEIGCHTFDHLDAWYTPVKKFMHSVTDNMKAFDSIVHGARLKTFAYPKSGAALSVKFHLEKHFICCRGGGQTFNAGKADLNLLKAFFLDKRNKVDLNMAARLIDLNNMQLGWLIFATHDVSDNPSPYGCTPEFFEDVVKYAVDSGALILPVAQACEKIQKFS